MLYGRASEQAAIRDLVDATHAGRSGGLVVRGEPGIGKSTLLTWAAEYARGAGLTTLRVTGVEGRPTWRSPVWSSWSGRCASGSTRCRIRRPGRCAPCSAPGTRQEVTGSCRGWRC
ncbi:ATP-binding protein [Nonomuraea antimicrobica]